MVAGRYQHFILAFACFVLILLCMATLYKQPRSPFYFARFTDADGNRVSRTTGTTSKREAGKIAERYEVEAMHGRADGKNMLKGFSAIVDVAAREANNGTLTLARAAELVSQLHKLANPDFREITLRSFWQEWIDEQTRHVGKSTATGYAQDLALLSHALGAKVMNASVQSLTTAQITAAIDKAKKPTNRSETGKRPVTRTATTINKALAALRRVMEAAIAQKLATHNPAKLCRTLGTQDSTTRSPFTITEIRAMLDHDQTSDEWRGAITIAAHTGLRLSDVLSLTSKHVDGTHLVIMPSKTAKKKKVITVPLTPMCIKWMGQKKGDFFPTLKKQSTALCSTQFVRIMERAGVSKEIELPGGIIGTRSFHALRHTFASWLAEADVHADVRQKLTGHASSKIHQRYTHHDQALDRAVATLPKF